jgi:hypothetical protein
MAINEPGDAITGSSTVLAAFGRGLDGGGWYHERQPLSSRHLDLYLPHR